MLKHRNKRIRKGNATETNLVRIRIAGVIRRYLDLRLRESQNPKLRLLARNLLSNKLRHILAIIVM